MHVSLYVFVSQRTFILYHNIYIYILLFSLEMKQIASNYTIESVLSSIHCYRCHNHIELIAIVNVLSDFIKQHNQVMTFKLKY